MKFLIKPVLICTVILSFLLNERALGQSADTIKTNKPTYYKHEIGYIVPYGILYRYHFKRNALRCIINYKNFGIEKHTGATIRTKIGGQYAFINKKVKLFGGLDFLYLYSRDLPPNHVSNASIIERYTNMSIGISPFLGMNYIFKKRFSVGIEVASAFFYTWYSNVADGYYSTYSDTHYYSSSYLYSISLNISYHF